MTKILKNQYDGGKNLTQGQGKPGETLADSQRDTADDLAALQSPAISNADATNLAEVLLLANELRANAVTNAAVTIKTTKG